MMRDRSSDLTAAAGRRLAAYWKSRALPNIFLQNFDSYRRRCSLHRRCGLRRRLHRLRWRWWAFRYAWRARMWRRLMLRAPWLPVVVAVGAGAVGYHWLQTKDRS